MQKILNLIKAHKIISSIILIVVIFAGYSLYKKTHATTGKVSYVTQPATTDTVVVSVSGTGQVSAENKIDLKPGGSGQTTAGLTAVNVKQGDQVKAGEVIATVDEKNNNVALTQARASLQSAQASYDKLKAGLTGVDLQTVQLSVTEAQQALNKAQDDYNTTVTEQQQAVSKALSNFLNADLTAEPINSTTTVTPTITGAYSDTVQGTYTINILQTPEGFNYTVSGLGTESGLITAGIPQPIGSGLYITFSSTTGLGSNNGWTIEIPNAKSTSYISNQYTYNSALQSQTDALASAKDNVTSAQNALTSAQLSLSSKTAPPTDADVASSQAQIAQAEASLASAEVNYDNNIIKSPFDGVVAQLNNQPGDQVNSSTVIATIITNQQLAVMPLNEIDAVKVQVGQKANLTFDAINGLNIAGQVAEIDTIGTVSQGVVTYTAKVAFDSQDSRIKPGMSVTAAIITNVATDVLTVPNSAVKSNANGSYVQILVNGKPQDKPVQVGISNDTETQITSGLNPGDQIITQTISSSPAATTSRTTTGSIIPGLGGGGGGGRVFINGGGGGAAKGN
jgi:HlyD family secretion protein